MISTAAIHQGVKPARVANEEQVERQVLYF